MRNLKVQKALIIGLIMTLALVAIQRFDRQDTWLIHRFVGKTASGEPSLGDSIHYVNYVRFFREQADILSVTFPFVYRPVTPYLASLLPFKDPMTALNVINLICLYLVLAVLWRWLRRLGFSFSYTLLGGFLYAVSFPVFYYGTDGCVDPAGLLLLALGVFSVYSGKWGWLFPILMIGGLTKETAILAIPVFVAYRMMHGKRWLLLAAGLLVAFFVPFVLIRYLLWDVGHYSWAPSVSIVMRNMRWRAVLSLLLTFGIPGLLSLRLLLRYADYRDICPPHVVLPLTAGAIFTFGLVIYSFVAAFTDGRFMWPMTIFAMPTALCVVRRWREQRISLLM